MTVSARNRGAQYRPPLLGDQGMPWCAGCQQRPRYGTDRDGRLVEHCRCGSRVLSTIGHFVPPPEREPAKRNPHTQSAHHPWKTGIAADVPWRRGHPPMKRTGS